MNANSKTNLKSGIATALIATFIASALMAQSAPPAAKPDGAKHGYMTAPSGSETLSIALDASSMTLYASADFKGTEAKLMDMSKSIPVGQANKMPTGLQDSMTSLRWNLPHGIVVVFYEDSGLKGEQLVLWGSGESSDVGKWNFNDKASRWAWFDVGGGGGAATDSASSRLAPAGTEALSVAVPENTIQMFKDDKFRNDMKQIDNVTSITAGGLQKMPKGVDDSLTSLRWNLPEGVVVMLHEDSDGKKDRIAIWGKGEASSLNLWDFNDKVSRWSWAYVGAPAKTD